jgi:hypothetical protein
VDVDVDVDLDMVLEISDGYELFDNLNVDNLKSVIRYPLL